MWAIAKIKQKKIHTFKRKMVEKFGMDVEFYYPKVQHHKFFKNKIKKFEKFIFENYIFCYHKKFVKKNTINEAKNLNGLDYFLNGYCYSQKEITKFIDHCRSFENRDGYLTQAFFKNIIAKKAQFVSGPFTNMMFEVIEKQKNKIKILIGNVVTTMLDERNLFYRPI
mgnify:CR=1 FL=1|tara:strand:- start:885 stop:1385 length:501 start_codon:yes stop_codon:yes gene_type:complete